MVKALLERRLEMGKAMLRVAVVMAALLALSTAATADLTVNYEGSFNLPVATGWNDYYAGSLVFVPDKATRPGWNGATVKGPTLVVTYNHYQKTVEFDQLPALAKDAGSLGTANWLTNANGGTYWDGSRLVGDVDSVGTVWDIRGGGSSSTNDGMFRDPFGGHVLGGTSAAVLNADWYSVHPVGGALRKGDGAGGDLITDGSTVGAKFVISQRSNPGDVGAWAGKVTEVTRTGAGENDVTTQHLFQYYGVSDADRHHCVQYVRDLGGEEWFVL